MREPQDILISVQTDAGYIMVWPPVECSCGRSVALCINRDGKTRCVDCDETFQKVKSK